MKAQTPDPLTPTLRRRVGAMARRTGKTSTAIVRKAVLTHLEDLEDIQRALAAEKRARSRQPFKVIARELGLAR